MPLEKTPENILTCQVCKQKVNNKRGLSTHLRKHKITIYQYYDQFFKLPNEGVCIICQKETKYERHLFNYQTYCSINCQAKSNNVLEKRKKTNLLKFGVEYPLQNKKIKDKMKQKFIEKYGVDNPFKNSKIIIKIKQTIQNRTSEKRALIYKKRQQTFLNKYGVDCYGKTKKGKEAARNIIQKLRPIITQTNILKYGSSSPFSSKSVQIKSKETYFKNHGVRHNSQIKEVQNKAFKTSHQSKPYVLPSGKIVYKMGYEPLFLDYVFQNNILKEDEIDYSPKGIKYINIKNIESWYFPDFYIPKWNLIVEIKSTWTLNWDKNVYLKEESTKQHGFKYIRIINNPKQLSKNLNFQEFNQILDK